MAVLAYTLKIQDRIFRELGIDLSTADAFTKALIDDTWTTGALGGGVALDALTQCQQFGQWFSLSDAAGVSQWDGWLVARTVLMAGRTLQPERVPEFEKANDDAEMAALDAYTPSLFTVDPGATAPEPSTLTMANILSYVIHHCARRERWHTVEGVARRRPRLWVPPTIIYHHTERVLRNLWSRANWPFRRRAVTLVITPYSVSTATYTSATKTVTCASSFATTIPAGATVKFISGTGITACERVVASATASTVVLTAAPLGVTGDLTTGDIKCIVVATLVDGLTSAETFHSVATREFCYSDSTGRGSTLTWAKDGTQMSQRRAIDSDGTTTGRPTAFRFENNAALSNSAKVDVFAWTHSPIPDTTYYASGEVYVKGPTVTSLSATTTAMARFPAEFDHVIKDAVLAEVLRHHGDPQGREMWADVEEEIKTLLPQFCDVGVQDDDNGVRDVYQDFDQCDSAGVWGGGL